MPLATVVLDTSGSTSGKGLREAKAALQELTGAIVKPNDRVAVLGFSGVVTTVQPLAAAADVDLPAALDKLHATGRTALYDAVLAGLAAAKAGYDSQRRRDKARVELVVLTDGDDTSSTATFKEMAEALASPGVANFNMTLVAVGMPPEPLCLFTALCDSKKHLHLIAVEDHGRIKHAFGKVKERIVMQVTSTTVVQRVRADVSCGRPPSAQRRGRHSGTAGVGVGRGAGAGSPGAGAGSPGAGAGVVQYRRRPIGHAGRSAHTRRPATVRQR